MICFDCNQPLTKDNRSAVEVADTRNERTLVPICQSCSDKRYYAAKRPAVPTCRWTYDDHDASYRTSCGETFTIDVNNPKIRFCPQCGRRIEGKEAK